MSSAWTSGEMSTLRPRRVWRLILCYNLMLALGKVLISLKLSKIVTEHIDSKCSSESQLFFVLIRSVRFLARTWDNDQIISGDTTLEQLLLQQPQVQAQQPQLRNAKARVPSVVKRVIAELIGSSVFWFILIFRTNSNGTYSFEK